MSGSTVKKVIGFLYCTALLLAVAVLAVYYPVWGNTILLVLFPIGIMFIKGVFFEKLKLATLIVGRILISLAALAIFPGDWLVVLVIWLLRINILEATIEDFHKKNYFNAISGLVLIATSFWMSGSWNGTYYLINQDQYIWWILAYTLWNWDFVTLNFSSSISLYHVGVLGAPLVWMLASASPGFWLIFRGSTLIFAVTNQILFKKQLEDTLYIPGFNTFTLAVKKMPVQLIFMICNIILCAVSLALLV